VSPEVADRLTYRSALAAPEFRALLAGQLVSVAGLSVASVALTVMVYRQTGSPFFASLTFALSFVPYLVGGGLLSAVVDRFRPRGLVAACDGASALLMGAIALPGLPLVLVFALLLGAGTLASISGGARAALVRAAVSSEAYVPARSLLRIASQLAQIGGNAGGGALLVFLSPSGALLVDAGALIASALTVRLAVANHPIIGEPGGQPLLKDSIRGAREVFRNDQVRRLILIGWLAPMCIVAPEAVAAPYVTGHHGSPALVGWWLVALPIGLIAGDLAGVRLLTAHQQRRLVAPSAAAGFIPFLAFVLDPSIPVGMALLVISGACGIYVLGLDARIRDAAPAELFARTMTVSWSGQMAVQGLGFALAGALAEAVGPAGAVACAGGCGLLGTVALMRADLWRRPRFARAPVVGPRG
jgi:Major Facilitator Superfamily